MQYVQGSGYVQRKWVYPGGKHVPRGWTMSRREAGGVTIHPSGGTWDQGYPPTPPLSGQTDTCVRFTFPPTSLAGGQNETTDHIYHRNSFTNKPKV